MRNDKDEVLIGKAVKTARKILFDKRRFDIYDNADKALKIFVLIDVNGRQRPNSHE